MKKSKETLVEDNIMCMDNVEYLFDYQTRLLNLVYLYSNTDPFLFSVKQKDKTFIFTRNTLDSDLSMSLLPKPVPKSYLDSVYCDCVELPELDLSPESYKLADLNGWKMNSLFNYIEEYNAVVKQHEKDIHKKKAALAKLTSEEKVLLGLG